MRHSCMRGSARRLTDGFTLIELMVTIAIVAVLVAIAFPSFESTIRSNRVATTTNELMASLSLARSEALRNPGGAAICTSTDGTLCDLSGNWNNGWIVWIDVNGDGLQDPVDDRVVRSFATSDKLDVSVVSTASSALPIFFNARGRVEDATSRTFSLQPVGCTPQQPFVRVLALSATGQTKIAKEDCV